MPTQSDETVLFCHEQLTKCYDDMQCNRGHIVP